MCIITKLHEGQWITKTKVRSNTLDRAEQMVTDMDMDRRKTTTATNKQTKKKKGRINGLALYLAQSHRLSGVFVQLSSNQYSNYRWPHHRSIHLRQAQGSLHHRGRHMGAWRTFNEDCNGKWDLSVYSQDGGDPKLVSRVDHTLISSIYCGFFSLFCLILCEIGTRFCFCIVNQRRVMGSVFSVPPGRVP